MCLAQGNYIQERIQDFLIVGSNLQGWGGGVIGSVLYLINCYFSWFS